MWRAARFLTDATAYRRFLQPGTFLLVLESHYNLKGKIQGLVTQDNRKPLLYRSTNAL